MTEIQNDTDQVWSIGEFDIRICFGFRVYKFPKAKKVRNNNLLLIKGGII